MGYHKVVDGKTFDGHLFAVAEEAVGKSADGKITLDDALEIYEAVIDGGIYTDVERETVEYLLSKMSWRADAREWFLRELKVWEEREMKSIPMTPEELSHQHFPKEDILVEEFDRVSREVHLRAATKETYDTHDEIALIVRLADGRRVEVRTTLVELEDDFVELRGGVAIPLRAIEKVEI
jgi:hypothetical protein